jgi:hypothetical protein
MAITSRLRIASELCRIQVRHDLHYPRAPPQREPNTTGSSCPILRTWLGGRQNLVVTQTRPTRR